VLEFAPAASGFPGAGAAFVLPPDPADLSGDGGFGAAGRERASLLPPIPAEALSPRAGPQGAPDGGAAGGGGRRDHGRGECGARDRAGGAASPDWGASLSDVLSPPPPTPLAGRPDPEGVYSPELSPGPPLAGTEDPSRPQHARPEASTFIWTGNDSRFV